MKQLPVHCLFQCLAVCLLAGEVKLTTDIVYARRGPVQVKFDIACPSRGTLRPAIVCIHGGAWAGGSRVAYRRFILKAARAGYVAASVDYRLTPIAPWPAQIDDVKAAFQYLINHVQDYGIDPERIGAIGDSAGGHLALMLGCMDGELKDGPRLRCVVNLYGPTDLREIGKWEHARGVLQALVGGKLQQKREVLKNASPVVYVDPTDPPVLTFHGTKDKIVPFNQATILHEALKKAGVPNRLLAVEGAGHGLGKKRSEIDGPLWRFFAAYLKGPSMPLLVAEDFAKGAGRWQFTDPNAWRVEKRKGDSFLVLHNRRSNYTPPFRSPYNISLLTAPTVGDFVMDVDLRSTIRPYGHQDLCLFFGYRDPGHYYYVHIGRRADPHANSIFIVNGAPRVSIATERTRGTAWTKGWHRARLVRDTESGDITVYFDDMEKPAMRARDKTFLGGRIGVGSFDDTGEFDALRLWGSEACTSHTQKR